MTPDERRIYIATLRVATCCRDWAVTPLAPMGRCGLCGERPVITDKPLADYIAERELAVRLANANAHAHAHAAARLTEKSTR